MQIIKTLFVVLSLALSAKAHGQDNDFDEIAKRLTMSLMEPQLYGGRPATAAELSTASWLGFCTANFIGNDVSKNKAWTFTAAHCVTTGQRVNFRSRSGLQHSGVCERHNNYNDQTVTWDFAICEVSPALPEGSLLAEFDASPVKVGDGLIMAGYGRPNIAELHVGSSVVYRLSAQDIITRTAVSLGSGDSGGSLLRGPTDLEKGPFKIIGVNSRKAISGNESYFNRIELENSQRWLKDYAQRKSAPICGVNVQCGKPVPPVVPDKCLGDQEMVKYFGDELAMAQVALASCVSE